MGPQFGKTLFKTVVQTAVPTATVLTVKFGGGAAATTAMAAVAPAAAPVIVPLALGAAAIYGVVKLAEKLNEK